MTEINIVDPPTGEVQSGEAQAPNPNSSAPIGVEPPPAVPVVVPPPVEPTSEAPAVIAPVETQEQLVQEKPAPAKNEKMLILGNGGTPLPEGPVNFGMSTVVMPNEEAQKTGFAIPAELVGPFIAQFQQYKFKELRPMGT